MSKEETIIAESAAELVVTCKRMSRQAVLSLCGDGAAARLRSGGATLLPGTSRGSQSFDTNQTDWPLYQPLPKLEAKAQVLPTLLSRVSTFCVFSTVL